jgi:hypothetical protein
LRIEGRENGDLGTVAPYSGVALSLQMKETNILVRLLWMYIPRKRKYGSALTKVQNFGGVEFKLIKPPSGTPLV